MAKTFPNEGPKKDWFFRVICVVVGAMLVFLVPVTCFFVANGMFVVPDKVAVVVVDELEFIPAHRMGLRRIPNRYRIHLNVQGVNKLVDVSAGDFASLKKGESVTVRYGLGSFIPTIEELSVIGK